MSVHPRPTTPGQPSPSGTSQPVSTAGAITGVAASSSLVAYEGIAAPGTLRLARHLADELRGRTFLHVNATRRGGGVAEILERLLPLLEELGIRTRWEVIEGEPPFFVATKKLHNALQGGREPLTPVDIEVYHDTNRTAARTMDLDADVAMIHDPQPAGLIQSRPTGARWIWRCHIDLSSPQRAAWDLLEPSVGEYDATVFHMAQFARRLSVPQYLVHPSIDPLSPKNRELPAFEVERRLEALGVPLDRPLLVQVSRFDSFKDPLGVIAAYRLVRRFRDAVLVLAGGTADDDPEGQSMIDRVREAADGDPDIHVLVLPPDAHEDINALQSAATVVVQKSLREGFGLTVAEAMWKGKPVVGGAVGGITAQIEDGVTGLLVHSVEGAAYALRRLLGDAELRSQMGLLAREHARRNSLITRHLVDYLLLLRLHLLQGHADTLDG
jgi:trehalose synthase